MKRRVGCVDRARIAGIVSGSTWEGHGAMKKRGRQARGRRSRRTWAPVVDLSSVRAQKRRELAERRVRSALDENRAALARPLRPGLLFTQNRRPRGPDPLP